MSSTPPPPDSPSVMGLLSSWSEPIPARGLPLCSASAKKGRGNWRYCHRGSHPEAGRHQPSTSWDQHHGDGLEHGMAPSLAAARGS